ncbi:unnamed protein product [Brassica rapa subsp. trilocularis]
MKQSRLGFRSTSVGLSSATARWRFGVVTSVDGVSCRKVSVLGLWRNNGSVFSSFSIYSSVSGAGAWSSVGVFSLHICFSSSPFLWNPLCFSSTAVIPGEQVGASLRLGGASSLCGLTATHVLLRVALLPKSIRINVTLAILL